MDHTRFIKITTEKNNRIIINTNRIEMINHIEDTDQPYQVHLIDGTWYNITKEQFEEFWG